MTLREYAGGAKRTALTADITAASTTFSVVDGTGYPTGATGPFAIAMALTQAGEEKVLCSARSGNTFTVATGGRGYDGTAASAHAAGSTVDHVVTAVDLAEANAHVNTPHAASVDTSAFVTLTGTQTLTNKTLTSPAINTPTFGAPLTQAQTHGSPDTDAATTSLHHTIGTTATQAAAGNHTHAASTGVLGRTQYAPATNTIYTLTTANVVQVLDATNLAVTFTAPSSGAVLMRLTGYCPNSNTRWGVVTAGGTVFVGVVTPVANGALASAVQLVTGLTPGQSYTWQWAGVAAAASVPALHAQGIATGGGTGAPAVMEVQVA